VSSLEEKSVDEVSLKRMESRVEDQLRVRDEAANIRIELEEKISKAKEGEISVSELDEAIKKAEDMLKRLDKRIGMMDDFIKKERSILESLRVLTLVRKVSSIVGGFLLFSGGVLLTLSILIVTKILIIPPTISIQLFFGYLLLIVGIIMLLSGTLHQVA